MSYEEQLSVDVSRSEKFGQDLSSITSREAIYKGLRQRVRLLKFVREYLLGRQYQLSSSLQWQVARLRSQLGEKYFDYSLSCPDNPEKNTATTSSSTLSTAACHAQGLLAAHSRKLSATLGARHQLTPECGSSYSRPTISLTSAMR
jgi:hypothetical protein